MVLSVNEQTALQPRPRLSPTLPAQPQPMPNRHAPASTRAGALTLVAALDTRAGQVDGHRAERKRQRECLACLAVLHTDIDEGIRLLPFVCDHGRTPQGQAVRQG